MCAMAVLRACAESRHDHPGARCNTIDARHGSLQKQGIHMKVKRWSLAALAFISSAFAGTAGVPGGAADIRVEDAWIKPFPNEPAVGYATLTNTASNPVSLERVSSPYFDGSAMVRSYAPHRSMPVKNFLVKGHSTLDLRSNHLHILLSRPHGSLDVHQKIPLVLGFSDGSTMTVQFEVRQQ